MPELFRSALDALPVHVCVLDEAATVLWVNRSWRQFAIDNGGQADSTAEGSNYLGVCDAASGARGEQAAPFAAMLQEVLRGERDHFELEYPCHSPSELRWFVAGAAHIDGPGPARVVVSHQHVTGRKLAEARERESQRLEALGTLAGGIAHDFNNVLGAVLGNAALLLQRAEPGQPDIEALQHIQCAAMRGRELVRRVLAFGRQSDPALEPLPLAELLRETMALLATGRPAGVTQNLQVEADGDTQWVLGNATELQQALMNLVTNAWLALEGQPGEVVVGLKPSEPGHVALSVRDSGCGIAETDRPRIFEPFFTTRPVGKGSGLGLAQVHGVVTRMGGQVDVTSAMGAGSTFTLRLPLCEARPQAAPEDAPPPRVRDVVPPLPLLLVDDDEVVGLTLEALLARGGHKVERLTSAHAALRELARPPGHYAVLVSDHTMPEMSGMDLCRAARVLRPGLSLVIVSGYVSDELRQGAAALGATLVAKEEAFERLLPAVAAAATGSPSPSAAEQSHHDGVGPRDPLA